MNRRLASALVFAALAAAGAARPAFAHGDVPEADVACTGSALLNDDLAPRTPGAHRTVSARAEVLDASGSPVGTFYLDDRGERYVTFEAGVAANVVADFPTATASNRGAGDASAPIALARDFTLAARYHLSACR